jgi:membrane-bound ClpP family serine protease
MLVNRSLVKFLGVVAAVLLGVVAWVISTRWGQPDPSGILTEVDGVAVITISDAIDSGVARRVKRSLAELEHRGVPEVIVVLDSPGGDVGWTFKLADALQQSTVTTHGLLKSVHGGTTVLVPVMNHLYCIPTAMISGPTLTAGAPSDPRLKKVDTYLRVPMETAAKAQGHDPRIFAALGDESYELVVDGRTIKRAGSLFTLTAAEALRLKLSKATVASVEELVERLKAPAPTPPPAP